MADDIIDQRLRAARNREYTIFLPPLVLAHEHLPRPNRLVFTLPAYTRTT